jgi:plastocyanin
LIKKTLILPVLAAAAVAAGCGSGSSGSASTYGEPAAAATRTAAAAAPTTETKVDIANFAFAPSDIHAKVGDTITFTNQDAAPHTATATKGAKFDSGALAQGKSFSYTTKKAGTIEFVCSFHPNMVGTITVSS